jgi:hypothetical protein
MDSFSDNNENNQNNQSGSNDMAQQQQQQGNAGSGQQEDYLDKGLSLPSPSSSSKLFVIPQAQN